MAFALFAYGAAALIGLLVVVGWVVWKVAYVLLYSWSEKIPRVEWKRDFKAACGDAQRVERGEFVFGYPGTTPAEEMERLLDEEPGWFSKYSRRCVERRKAKGLHL